MFSGRGSEPLPHQMGLSAVSSPVESGCPIVSEHYKHLICEQKIALRVFNLSVKGLHQKHSDYTLRNAHSVRMTHVKHALLDGTSPNKVNLRRARLVLGWVTVPRFSSQDAGHLYRYVISHPGQLSLAILTWVGAMSTSQRAMTPCS